MGIDNINHRYITETISVTPRVNDAETATTVLCGASAPAGDTVKLDSKIPEWAKIEKSDGKIGDFSQGQTGDCWLLATLYALKLAGAENKFIATHIKKENGNLTVSFGSGKEQKEYSFTQQDIDNRILQPPSEVKTYTVEKDEGEQLREIIKKNNFGRLTGESIRRMIDINHLTEKDVPKAPKGRVLQVPYIFGQLSQGDIDVMAFEMAQEKFIEKEMNGNYPSFAMKNITGRAVTSITMSTGAASTGHEKAATDTEKSHWALFGYVLKNKPNVAVIACTPENVDKSTGLIGPHAYTIDIAQSTSGQVVFVNPHNTKERKTMTREEFKRNFSYVVMADLNDYQTYKVENGDSLSKIASKKGVKPQDLMLANPTLKSVDKLKIGMTLNIPVIK